MTDLWNTQETPTLSCAAPHFQHGPVHVCTIYPACGPWKLGVWVFVPHSPVRTVAAFKSELFRVTTSSGKNDTIFCSTDRSTEFRTENSINGMKKTCFVLHPSLQNVPIGISGGLTPRKKQLGAFAAVVGAPRTTRRLDFLEWGGITHYPSKQFPVCGNLARLKAKGLSNGWIHWKPTKNTHASALVLTVTCNPSILCNTAPHLWAMKPLKWSLMTFISKEREAKKWSFFLFESLA